MVGVLHSFILVGFSSLKLPKAGASKLPPPAYDVAKDLKRTLSFWSASRVCRPFSREYPEGRGDSQINVEEGDKGKVREDKFQIDALPSRVAHEFVYARGPCSLVVRFSEYLSVYFS